MVEGGAKKENTNLNDAISTSTPIKRYAIKVNKATVRWGDGKSQRCRKIDLQRGWSGWVGPGEAAEGTGVFSPQAPSD